MLNFKSKVLSEQELRTQLRIVIENCEVADFKTKKFIGLLYDYIPYNNGLKTRLELIGKMGYMEEVIKLGKDPASNSKKIERFSVQMASEYGFRPEVMISTFKLLADVLAIPIKSIESDDSVQGSQMITNAVKGNFSKNHRKEIADQEIQTRHIEPVHNTLREGEKKTFRPKPKRKWVRNKGNLFKILFFMLAIVAGEFYLNYYFQNKEAFGAFKSVLRTEWPFLTLASAFITLIVYIGHNKFKVNLTNAFPILVLIIQLVGIAFKVEVPILYENAQVAIFSVLLMSFILITGYAIRLPKGAKEFISYKAIYSYYATGILFLLGQYLVRVSV